MTCVKTKIMNTFEMSTVYILLLFCSFLHAAPLIDFEEHSQDFVLETKRIVIPEFKEAFNPSIIRWRGSLLMSFRIVPDPKQSFTSHFGLIWLDDDFNPIGHPQLLNIRDEGSNVPPRADDARLINSGDTLYFIYSDNAEPKISRAGFRVYVAELQYEKDHFFLKNKECLSFFEGSSPDKREKNWVPFDYEGNLLLAYSINPHTIFYPLLGTGECTTIAQTTPSIRWKFGPLRGGTPGLMVGNEYLSFFHSCIDMASVHSDGQHASHYFMGAYTFSKTPPFALTQISPTPIVGKNFYRGTPYQPYWKPICCIFPCGFIFDEKYIWVAYGRQDHEVWIVKLDKQGLLNSLTAVTTS